MTNFNFIVEMKQFTQQEYNDYINLIKLKVYCLYCIPEII